MNEKPEKMTFAEFEKKYMKSAKGWDFSKFGIVCKKCGSSKVEYNNTMDIGVGYYDEIEYGGELVVKCHDCGNAMNISTYDLTT